MSAADYFARVTPLLGAGLKQTTLRLTGDAATRPFALRLVELLASCRLGHVEVPRPWVESVRAAVTTKNPYEPPLVSPHANGPAVALHLDLGDEARVVADGTVVVSPTDIFASLDALLHAARHVRDQTPLDDASYGAKAWPFSPRPHRAVAGACPLPRGEDRRRSEASRWVRGESHIVVCGLGSVGSEVVRLLEPLRPTWSFIDPGTVSVFNLLRQWFDAADLGRKKPYALASRVAEVHAAISGPATPDTLAQLHQARPIALLVLATGTRDHSALAQWAHQQGIPHIAACAYPQARHFEVLFVDPRQATPCFDCYRGHLYRSVEAPPTLSDEVAQFVYATPERYKDLVAEPATAIDTVRIASVAARVGLALMAAEAPPWFERCVTDATTCLVGANVVTARQDGDVAYGIHHAGQVVRLGLDDLVGDDVQKHCPTCRRVLTLAHRLPTLPACAPACSD